MGVRRGLLPESVAPCDLRPRLRWRYRVFLSRPPALLGDIAMVVRHRKTIFGRIRMEALSPDGSWTRYSGYDRLEYTLSPGHVREVWF